MALERLDGSTVVGHAVHRAGWMYTRYALRELGYTISGTIAAVLSLLQDFVHVSLAAEVS